MASSQGAGNIVLGPKKSSMVTKTDIQQLNQRPRRD